MAPAAPVRDETDMREAARRLVDAGCRAVLIKGGHLEGDEVVDILFDGVGWRDWRAARFPVGNAHGTGCTLSAAITALTRAGGSRCACAAWSMSGS